MKNFAFPQHFISQVLRPAARATGANGTASPFTLSSKLLGDLATLFDRESQHASDTGERARLFKISRELDRMWRVKAASTRGGRR